MKKEEFQQNMKDRMQQFEDGGLRTTSTDEW